jgi:hypothetical protein
LVSIRLTHVAYIGAAANSDGSLTYICPSGVCTSSSADSYATSFISLAHANGVQVVMSINSTPANVTSDFPNATNSTHRAAFISNIVNYVNRDGFDGVDIDWELNLNLSQETSFLSALRTAIGSKLITIVAIPQFATAASYAGMQSYVDAIEVSTIDDGGGNPTWFNNPVYNDTPFTNSGDSIDRSLGVMRGGGVLDSKMLAGLAFYGELQTGATGPRQSAAVSTSQLRYTQIAANYPSFLSSPTRDSVALAPWFSPNGSSWVNYSDPTSITSAATYVKNSGIKGLWIWALDQDYFPTQTPQHPLMNAVAQALTPSAPSIVNTSPLPAATIGVSYLVTLTATGTTPVTWSITSGTLPAGLSLDSALGKISGTPTATGTATFTAQAANSVGSNSKVFALAVNAAVPVISSFTASPPSIRQGATSTLSWSSTGASSLSINQGIGTVTGASVAVSPITTTTYTLTATNTAGSATRSVTVTVNIRGNLGTPHAAAWPGHAATAADLFVAADLSTSTLASSITNAQTALTTTSASTFTANQIVRIDSELLDICSVSGTALTVCSSGRGVAGSTAVSHSSGAAVIGAVSALYHNQLSAELIALESSLWSHAGSTISGPGALAAGTSWPNHVATLNELLVAADAAQGNLSGGISNSTLTLPLQVDGGFAGNSIAQIDTEELKICSIDGTGMVLTVCSGGRGFGGTLAHSHSSGAVVSGIISTFYHNRIAAEIRALELDLFSTLGGGSSVSGVSWPNHAATLSELHVATTNGVVFASFHNRLAAELIALEGNLFGRVP